MGVAYVIPRLKVSGGKIISNYVSVFTGELLAILIAMNKIYEMGINKTLVLEIDQYFSRYLSILP